MKTFERVDFLKDVVVNGTKEKNLRTGNFNSFVFTDKPSKFLVAGKYVARLDLISMDAYGTDNFWWVIAKFNGICDPFTELVAGSVIEIPSLRNINTYVAENAKL